MRIRRRPRRRAWWLRRQRVPRPVGRAPLYHRVIMEDVEANLADYRQREAERKRARAQRAAARVDEIFAATLRGGDWEHYA